MIRRLWPALILAGLVLVGAGIMRLWPAAPGPDRTHAAEPAIIISPPPEPGAVVAPAPAPSPAAVREGLRVKMPELGIDLPIDEGDGLDAPLFRAAHYPTLAWPGEGRRSMIYAHARPGMFGPLFGARVGNHIVIDRPGAPPLRYVVEEYHPRWPITDLRWLQPADGEQLILVTCTTYNYNDPRIILVAGPEGRAG